MSKTEQSQNFDNNRLTDRPVIVGLDIGTTKIVAIAGQKNAFGKLEVLGFGKSESRGVEHGVVKNIEQCIHAIEQAMAKCIESNPGLEIDEVYVGIAGKHIKSLQTRGDRVRMNTDDEITREEIEELIRDQYKTYIPDGDQIIDVVPQGFLVDNVPTTMNPVGMSGVRVGANFHIVTADRNAVRNIKRCVDKSGLRTKDLVLQPLASAAAVINEEDLEAGVAIVDIGGGTTDMAVFYDGVLKHTAVIPYAGVNITNDIRNGLGILRMHAEAMKVQFGTALASEANANAYITIPGLRGLPRKEISVMNLAHIIQARMEEILNHVVHNLKQVDLDKRLYGGIILTGGGSQLKHIVQLTEYITGLGARLGLPNEHLAGGHSDALMNPSYATCIGLILRGYHDYEAGRPPMRSAAASALAEWRDQQSGRPSEAAEEEQAEGEVAESRVKERAGSMKKLFDQLKGKILNFFEDVEDQEMR